MKHSIDRIQTSHGGNLPRPKDLDAMIAENPRPVDKIKARLPTDVEWVIDKQIECGVTVVNDGEYVKAANASAYSGYIYQRITGWEQVPLAPGAKTKRGVVAARDAKDFPGTYESGLWMQGSGGPIRPGFATPGAVPRTPTSERTCTQAIVYHGYDAIAGDVDAVKKGVAGKDCEGFIAALGPLSLGAGARNAFYKTEEEYMFAVADGLREEYKAITDAGLILQVDEPEFATTWMFYPEWSLEDLRKYLTFAGDVINHAIRGLPEDQIRLHTCWGSGHRPHVNDIPFKHIADLMLRVNAQAYSFEASNVRHAHEWRVWEDLKLPEGKIIVPGVIAHATDLVEHPELVAERLCNFASLVGLENVHAGTDCGIGSRVGHEEIVWAKLKAMGEGAKIAYDRMKKK
jgi:5-methyltetrahydropteroyltriglutamate--homocysteine methyltransferase